MSKKKSDHAGSVNLPVKTLFIKPSALPPMTASPGKKYVDVGYEICEAMRAIKNVQPFHINGSTKIRGLWRLDLIQGESAHIARASILASGLSMRGHMVPVLSENPNLVNGEETSRLYVSNLPFSVSNNALKSALIEIGLQLGSSEIQWEMYRDEKNDMSAYKNGKRYIYIAPPKVALPKSIKVAGKFDAFINYKGPLPKTDILIEKQNSVRNQNGYTEDSDSESDIDDNDLVLKGLNKLKQQQRMVGQQRGFDLNSANMPTLAKSLLGGADSGLGAPLKDHLVSFDLSQNTPGAVREVGPEPDQGAPADGLLGGSYIDKPENVQQTLEQISKDTVEQNSNKLSGSDIEADSEGDEAKSEKQSLDKKNTAKRSQSEAV